MASSYSRWSPSTGPGRSAGVMPAFNAFQANTISLSPGYGYTSNLGPNNTPNPGPPAADINGILLENTAVNFIALETGQGGPTSVLVQE